MAPRKATYKASLTANANSFLKSFGKFKVANLTEETVSGQEAIFGLLAVCPQLAHLSADAVVGLYAQRMQIEEAFRDLNSTHFGLGFSAGRSQHKERLSVLLLIACLAFFVLRLIGQIAHIQQLERQCQSNTRRSRAVLSVISLARQLVRKGLANFCSSDLHAMLYRLRDGCSILPI